LTTKRNITGHICKIHGTHLFFFLQTGNRTDANSNRMDAISSFFARAFSRQRAARSDGEPPITKRQHRTQNYHEPDNSHNTQVKHTSSRGPHKKIQSQSKVSKEGGGNAFLCHNKSSRKQVNAEIGGGKIEVRQICNPKN
jgi:hypothetical protein